MKLETKKTLQHGGVAVGAAVITAIIGFIVSFIKGIFDKKIDSQVEPVEVVVETPDDDVMIDPDIVVEAEPVEATVEQ